MISRKIRNSWSAALLNSLRYTWRALFNCPCAFSSIIAFSLTFSSQVSFSYLYSCLLSSELSLNSLYFFSCMYSQLSSSGKITASCILPHLLLFYASFQKVNYVGWLIGFTVYNYIFDFGKIVKSQVNINFHNLKLF